MTRFACDIARNTRRKLHSPPASADWDTYDPSKNNAVDITVDCLTNLNWFQRRKTKAPQMLFETFFPPTGQKSKK